MSKLEDYSIQFVGISDGKHEYTFQITKDLFSHYENEDINDADIKVVVYLEKNVRHLYLSFHLKGSVQTICDRCLDALTIDIDYSPTLHVNFGDETSDLTDIDDVMTLNRSEEKLELSKHLYDYVLLNLPIQKIHNDEDCNSEMIENLEKYELGNSNTDEIDPRWEKLKHLYN